MDCLKKMCDNHTQVRVISGYHCAYHPCRLGNWEIAVYTRNSSFSNLFLMGICNF